ncbi:unnamed protein product, partial [Didymodactylos carnosus]
GIPDQKALAFVQWNSHRDALSLDIRRGGSERIENMPIKDRNGSLFLNSSDRPERWREYFSELLYVPSTADQHLIDEIQVKTLTKEDVERQNANPTVEVRRAVKQIKSRKASGSDEVTADILKAGGEPVILWLFEIFTDVWKNEEMVEDWSLALLIRLYKKGKKQL